MSSFSNITSIRRNPTTIFKTHQRTAIFHTSEDYVTSLLAHVPPTGKIFKNANKSIDARYFFLGICFADRAPVKNSVSISNNYTVLI